MSLLLLLKRWGSQIKAVVDVLCAVVEDVVDVEDSVAVEKMWGSEIIVVVG